MKDCISRSKLPLKEHQIKVINYMNKHKSLLVVHATGLGKTLTALTVSQCYIDEFPTNKVIVISPASLVHNFEKEMEKYGYKLSKNYMFYSFDKFLKENKNICNKSLIIIDEVHNVRSMKVKYLEIFKCVMKCHKLLLLTATPYVNSLLDFKPLINMLYFDEFVYERTNPESEDPIFKALYSKYSNYSDYELNLNKIEKLLKGKVSYLEKEGLYFPNVIVSKIDFTMSTEVYDKYEKALNVDKDFGKHPEVFYSGYRQAVNIIGVNNYLNQKINFIKILLEENKKIIIYTNWLEHGVDVLKKYLQNEKYGSITGKTSIETRNNLVNDYNTNKIKILILTKAGSEGLDLKETNYIVILDPVWNMATLDQIIGRGVRYKSHFNLPKNQQNVKVFLLILKTPKNSKNPSGDELLYDILKQKLYIKNDIEKILKNISI